MKPPTKVRIAAISFVAISVINIAVLLVFAGPQRMVSRAVRFILTCVLAYFLFRGKGWARWVVMVLSFLTSATSLLGAVALLPEAARLPLPFLIWAFVMGAAYAILGFLLAISKDVRAFFRATPMSATQSPPVTTSADLQQRYKGRPLTKILDSYVLWAIDALPSEQGTLLQEMAPKLAKAWNIAGGTWHEVVASHMEFPAAMPETIRKTWQKNQSIAASNSVTLSPQQFAYMFVDENFGIDETHELAPETLK